MCHQDGHDWHPDTGGLLGWPCKACHGAGTIQRPWPGEAWPLEEVRLMDEPPASELMTCHEDDDVARHSALSTFLKPLAAR